MIERFAEGIADRLVQADYIETTQKESYIYAMVMSAEQWISIIVLIILGACFHVVIPTLLFLVSLFAIRKHSGGFHANSYGVCFTVSVLTYICFVLWLYPYMALRMEITYMALAVSVIILEGIGAVNHPNMDWNREEYDASKRAARWTVAIEGLTICILTFLDANSTVIVFMAYAVILSAFLLLLAKIIKQEVSR